MIPALYLQVPFCRALCAYCDYPKTLYRRPAAEAYLSRLEKELDGISQEAFDTIYLGGGTPSALAPDQLEALLKMLGRFTVRREYTCELNPESATAEKAALLKRYGVNRVSLGVQSFQDHLLREMGRPHRAGQVDQALAVLRRQGLENISIDLMYGFSGQPVHELVADLEAAVKRGIPHISVYELEVHPDTPLGRQGYPAADDARSALMMETLEQYLRSRGYRHYEVSNFARPGFASVHNQHYWHYDDYLGLGPGASSKIGFRRSTETADPDRWLRGAPSGESVVLSWEDVRFEAVMMGLRMAEGIDLAEYASRFGCPLTEHYRAAVEKHCGDGTLVLEDGRLKPTGRGMRLLNDVLVDFMDRL
jgi:oxygen-independent coproporphyrinogen-3 oxidase